MQCFVTYFTGRYRCYLKLFQGYKLLNFGHMLSGHYFLDEGCQDSWLLFDAERGARAKILETINVDI
jgi:hypothetical protein